MPAFDEYQVKAVFLLNLTKFVRWPEESFTSPNAPFRIVILGDDPFRENLDKAVKGEAVQGHPIVIERRSRPEGLSTAHLLFISPSMKRRLPDILESVRTSHTLTVADQPGFCRQGGMIALLQRERRVQIETNAAAAEQAGLHINSKLLRISTAVGKQPE